MIHLVFSTQSAAASANDLISANMGCSIVGTNAATGLPDPAAQRTTRWALPARTLQGNWVFPKPAPDYMANVTDYTEANYDASWFPQPTIGI